MKPNMSHDKPLPTSDLSSIVPAPISHGEIAGELHRNHPSSASALENVRALRARALERTATPAPTVERVGIIGAGLMGTEIAAAHARRFVPVVLHDTSPAALDRARQAIADELSSDLPGRQAARFVEQLVVASADDEPLAQCGLVIESIPENMAAKKRLYSGIQRRLSPHAILVSNTSTMPIGQLAATSPDPTRFCGLHFCHPVRLRPLVEIIRGPATSETTIAAVVFHAREQGFLPLLPEDGPGFVVNRLLSAYLGESLDLLLDGVQPATVDAALREFGMPVGPLELADQIGLDTVLHSATVLSEAFGDRVVASPLIVGMVKAGQLGRKTEAGFFTYAGGEPISPAAAQPTNPQFQEILEHWSRARREYSPDAIVLRLLLPMILEATRILEEGKVQSAREIDLAAVFGLGFPAFRGGLLWWADTLGGRAVLEGLRRLALGDRGNPTYLLESIASSEGSFYGQG